jgi:hypothetical protein
MSQPVVTYVASDNAVTRRERQRQSDYREQALSLPVGTDRQGRPLGNYLPTDDRRHNFLSEEAAAYAASRVDLVRREGGQLEQTRLFTNMLSSMPLCFSVFGHLRAYPAAAVQVMERLLGRELAGLESVTVGDRHIDGIECEWAPDRRQHLDDGSAFDAVVVARQRNGRSLLVSVEVKYVDTFSRDPKSEAKDKKYRRFCEEFGMAATAFGELGGPATRQLLRNVLLTESVRSGGLNGETAFDEAVTLVLARDDDTAAQRAVTAVDQQRGCMPTAVAFAGHGQFADAAAQVDDLTAWAVDFRCRYVAPSAATR